MKPLTDSKLRLCAVSLMMLPTLLHGAPLLQAGPAAADEPYVLIVADEVDGVDVPQYFHSIYENVLNALGVDYNLWDHNDNGEPAADDLAPYDVVIWVTGNSCGYPADNPIYGHQAISLDEEAVLRQWLETPAARGLVLSGIWIGYNCVADESQDEQLASRFFDYSMGLDYPDENFTDWIEVDDDWTLSSAGGELNLDNQPLEWASVENYPDQLGTSIGTVEAYWTDPDEDDHNAAIISYQGSSWRSVFMACPLESIDGAQNRNDVMSAILDWFTEGPAALVEASWGQIKALE